MNYKKFKKKNYMTFSGIGNPLGFAQTLNKYGIKNESNIHLKSSTVEAK